MKRANFYINLKKFLKQEYLFLLSFIGFFLFSVFQTYPELFAGDFFLTEAATNYFRHSGNSYKQIFIPDMNYISLPQRLFSWLCYLLGIKFSNLYIANSLFSLCWVSFFSALINISIYSKILNSKTLRLVTSIFFCLSSTSLNKAYLMFTFYTFIPLYLIFALILIKKEIQIPIHAWLVTPFILTKPHLFSFIPICIYALIICKNRVTKAWTFIALSFFTIQVIFTKPFHYLNKILPRWQEWQNHASTSELHKSSALFFINASMSEINSLFFGFLSFINPLYLKSMILFSLSILILLLIFKHLNKKNRKLLAMALVVMAFSEFINSFGSPLQSTVEKTVINDIGTRYDLPSIFMKIFAFSLIIQFLILKSRENKLFIALVLPLILSVSSLAKSIHSKFFFYGSSMKIHNFNDDLTGHPLQEKYCNYSLDQIFFCNDLRVIIQQRYGNDVEGLSAQEQKDNIMTYVLNKQAYYSDWFRENKYTVLFKGNKKKTLEQRRYYLSTPQEIDETLMIYGFFLRIEINDSINQEYKFELTLPAKKSLLKVSRSKHTPSVMIKYVFDEPIAYKDLSTNKLSIINKYEFIESPLHNDEILVEWFGM